MRLANYAGSKSQRPGRKAAAGDEGTASRSYATPRGARLQKRVKSALTLILLRQTANGGYRDINVDTRE